MCDILTILKIPYNEDQDVQLPYFLSPTFKYKRFKIGLKVHFVQLKLISTRNTARKIEAKKYNIRMF